MNIGNYQFEKDIHWKWFTSHLQAYWSEDMGGFVSIDNDTHEPLGAILFSNWTQTACELMIVLTNPMVLRHGFLELLFGFAFVTNDRKTVYAHVSSDNKKSIRFVEHLGFTKEHVYEDGLQVGEDKILYVLRKENCRFIDHIAELKEAS